MASLLSELLGVPDDIEHIKSAAQQIIAPTLSALVDDSSRLIDQLGLTLRDILDGAEITITIRLRK